MTLRTFLLIDALALDAAAVALLVAGHTAAGVALLAVAAIAFLGFLALRRRPIAAGA